MAAKPKVDVLIENGTVVTVDPQRRVIRKGAVAIAKNRIMDVGKASALRRKYEAKRTYDATMKLVTPGLINAHIHFYHHMHRGLSPETLAGMPWSDFVHRRVATIVSAEDEIWGGLGILVETLKTGVTTFLEAGLLQPRPRHRGRLADRNAGLDGPQVLRHGEPGPQHAGREHPKVPEREREVHEGLPGRGGARKTLRRRRRDGALLGPALPQVQGDGGQAQGPSSTCIRPT